MTTTTHSDTWGALQATCRNCGHRHFQASRNNRICRGNLAITDWQRSAAGIAQAAAMAREDGERHYGRAIRRDGTVSEWRLQEARAAYAKAYELEN